MNDILNVKLNNSFPKHILYKRYLPTSGLIIAKLIKTF